MSEEEVALGMERDDGPWGSAERGNGIGDPVDGEGELESGGAAHGGVVPGIGVAGNEECIGIGGRGDANGCADVAEMARVIEHDNGSLAMSQEQRLPRLRRSSGDGDDPGRVRRRGEGVERGGCEEAHVSHGVRYVWCEVLGECVEVGDVVGNEVVDDGAEAERVLECMEALEDDAFGVPSCVAEQLQLGQCRGSRMLASGRVRVIFG